MQVEREEVCEPIKVSVDGSSHGGDDLGLKALTREKHIENGDIHELADVRVCYWTLRSRWFTRKVDWVRTKYKEVEGVPFYAAYALAKAMANELDVPLKAPRHIE